MKGKQFLALMAALALAVLLLIMAQGCYSPKKAEKQVSKALAYYPEQTIGKVRILAPCFTIGSSFSTDSAAYKASIDSLYNSRAWYESLIRGLESLPPHPLSEDTLCPAMAKELIQLRQGQEWAQQYIIDLTDRIDHIKPIIINRTDTLEDMGKVMEMDFKLLAQQELYKQQTEELTKARVERDEIKQGRNTWRKWAFIGGGSLLALLIAIGIYVCIQIKKP